MCSKSLRNIINLLKIMCNFIQFFFFFFANCEDLSKLLNIQNGNQSFSTLITDINGIELTLLGGDT